MLCIYPVAIATVFQVKWKFPGLALTQHPWISLNVEAVLIPESSLDLIVIRGIKVNRRSIVRQKKETSLELYLRLTSVMNCYRLLGSHGKPCTREVR